MICNIGIWLFCTAFTWAYYVNADTIHFVGGPRSGAQLGNSQAGGGCIASTFTGNLLDYMTVNGEPLIEFIQAPATNNGSGMVRLNIDYTSEVRVGTLVRITGQTFYSGVWPVLAVDPQGRWIDLDTPYSEDSLEDGMIGGAMDSLSTALYNGATESSGSDGNHYNRYICTNKNEVWDVVGEDALQFYSGGNLDYGTYRYIIGYADTLTYSASTGVVSDMDEGQPFYGGPRQALAENFSLPQPNPQAQWITLNANNLNTHIVASIGNNSNVQFRNLRFFNNATGYNAINFSGTTQWCAGWRFVNCRFEGIGLKTAIDATYSSIGVNSINGLLWDRCYFGPGKFIHAFYTNVLSSRVLNSIIAANTSTDAGYSYLYTYDTLFYQCLFYGGRGANLGGSTLIGCTFFDTDTWATSSQCSIWVDNAKAPFVLNCIFSPKTTSIPATVSIGGLWVYNSDAYSVSGGGPTPGFQHWDTSYPLCTTFSDGLTDIDCIEQNPLFRNANSGSFQLQSSSPCRNQGLSDLWGNDGYMGMAVPYDWSINGLFGGGLGLY